MGYRCEKFGREAQRGRLKQKLLGSPQRRHRIPKRVFLPPAEHLLLWFYPVQIGKNIFVVHTDKYNFNLFAS